jgi:4-hydroxybenzoate polyprenyltransferase
MAVGALIRLSSQSGTLLLMLPTFWALVVASGGRPAPALLAIFAAGSLLMRSAGVVLNDLADRSLDREVARTRNRPLASGALDIQDAALTLVVLLGTAGGLVLLLPPAAIALSPVALALAVVYPFAKRWVQLPQAVLGLAFGWGVMMAWASVRDSLDLPAWLLYGATLSWAVAYDTIYALQDREDDRRIGIRSGAILFGSRTWLAVGVAFGVMLLLLAAVGWLAKLSAVFYVVLGGIGVLLGHEVRRLRRPVEAPEAFGMFRRQVWVGGAVLVGLWLGFAF